MGRLKAWRLGGHLEVIRASWQSSDWRLWSPVVALGQHVAEAPGLAVVVGGVESLRQRSMVVSLHRLGASYRMLSAPVSYTLSDWSSRVWIFAQNVVATFWFGLDVVYFQHLQTVFLKLAASLEVKASGYQLIGFTNSTSRTCWFIWGASHSAVWRLHKV
jgi:hypothetical protein